LPPTPPPPRFNPNCGIFYPPKDPGSADIILAHDPAGHRGFLDIVSAAALALRFVQRDGYGLHATQDIAPDELIEAHEERPVHLVSRAHVERNWDAERQRWWRQYAYPISDALRRRTLRRTRLG